MSLLETHGLSYAYPGAVPALNGLDLKIERGRRLAILGQNGSGKTSLLLHLNGTLRPQTGQVLLDGRPVGYSRAELSAWRRRVGLVLQDADDQLFAASVEEDVSFGPLNLGLNGAQAAERVQEALAALRISHLAQRPTHMLSFGQKKRAAIAGAVAMRPEILLLDEPTSGLDQHGVEGLLEVLRKLHADGATLVFTTHDVDLAYEFAEDVALFDDGKVVRQGRAEDVLGDDDSMSTARLRTPFVLSIGLAARAVGKLSAQDPLPKTRDDALVLLGDAWIDWSAGQPRSGEGASRSS